MLIVNEQTDSRTLRDAFSCFPTGVAALCAEVDGERVGMAASSFTCVSLEPPIVSVCIQNGSRTWAKLEKAERIGVSVLGANQEQIVRNLARREGDRFEGAEPHVLENGAVLVTGAPLWLDCSVWDTTQVGDHLVVFMQIHGSDAEPTKDPLIFHASSFRLLEVLK